MWKQHCEKLRKIINIWCHLGLDPALPLFVSFDNTKKLDKSDAEFVDVIHTNALRRGKLETCGHVDFYVNGGLNQPGCEDSRNNNNMSKKIESLQHILTSHQ